MKIKLRYKEEERLQLHVTDKKMVAQGYNGCLVEIDETNTSDPDDLYYEVKILGVPKGGNRELVGQFISVSEKELVPPPDTT